MLIGIGTFALMLWEPNIEGRNVHSTLFEVYFKDPFLAYAYIASLSFFVALYQAFKVLGYVRQNKTFSQATVKALRTIKYSAIALVGFIVVPVAYLFIVRPGDDIGQERPAPDRGEAEYRAGRARRVGQIAAIAIEAIG